MTHSPLRYLWGACVFALLLGCTSGVTRGSGDRQDCRVVTNGDDSIREVICRLVWQRRYETRSAPRNAIAASLHFISLHMVR